MAPYIFAKRGTIHIIDIKKTLRGLLIAKKMLAEIVADGKDVVFVGTKRQAQKAVEGAADRCAMHYVSQRWLGGTLTNFRTIRSRLQRLEELEAMVESGAMEAESKKQASRLKREMRKISTNLGGIRKMSKLPGAVVIVDAKKEHLALAEAKKLGIPTVGILDTDANPDDVDIAIPANDDSIRAIDILITEMSDAVAIGKTMVAIRREEQAREAAVKGRSARPAMGQAKGTEQDAETKAEDTKVEETKVAEEPAQQTPVAEQVEETKVAEEPAQQAPVAEEVAETKVEETKVAEEPAQQAPAAEQAETPATENDQEPPKAAE
jgi:small subunit ribosomal protein S2